MKTAAQSLLQSLFTTMYIDPELYSSTLRLLVEYNRLLRPDLNSYQALRCNEYLNFTADFNLIVCYHPAFTEKYHLAQVFLNRFKEELNPNDTLSLFTYSEKRLKRRLNRKPIDKINLEENIDTYLNSDVSIENRNSLNFFQRFANYLEKNHEETGKQLCSRNYKNLIVAFTWEKEWKYSQFDLKTKHFLRSLKIEQDENKNSYFLWIIVIVFPEKPLLEYIGDYFDFEYSDTESMLSNISQETEYENIENIDTLKEMIDSKNYPINIIRVSEKKDSIRNAIDFVSHFIKFSKYRPLRLGFQNLLG